MLKIVGDINFTDGFWDTGFGIGSSIKKGLDPFAKLKRNPDDFWIGNFECVCSESTNKKGIYSKQFRIEPEKLQTLKHLNLYNVANNHVMQHGEKAYNEMLLNITTFGSEYFGSNRKRYTVFEHQGKNIAIMGFSQRPEAFCEKPCYWSMPEYNEIQNEFRNIINCDYKIAYIHWGNEYINYPYNDQIQFAHWLIDIGFDLIIGVHPHVLQGYERYKNKYIFYSIGNFVFNQAWEPTKYSTIINVNLDSENPISFEYIKIEEDYFPMQRGNNIPDKFKMKDLTGWLVFKKSNEHYYNNVRKNLNKYRKANHVNIIKNLYRFRISDISEILKDFLKRRV